jgi:hypothetical protein
LTRSLPSSPERRPRLPVLRRLLFPALLLAGATVLSAPATAAGAPERARAILGDSRYQTRLPQHEAPRDLDEGQTPPAFGGGINLPPVAAPALSAGAELTRIVFIVLAVAVVALVLARVVQTMAQRMARGRQSAGSEVEVAGEEAGPERELDVGDATRLAAEGRYGEAIHALLLAAIQHFAARARVQVQPSRTSRELARLLPLSGESRAKFYELVMAVERTLFGGAPAGPEDFQRSLERFRSLVRSASPGRSPSSG